MKKRNKNFLPPTGERFKHFVQHICDTGCAWGLYNDGWALSGKDEGADFFPLWPTFEHAELCAHKYWKDFVPEKIPLEELINELIPQMTEEKKGFSLFRHVDGWSIHIAPEALLDIIYFELENG